MPQRGLPAINFFFFHDKQTTTGKYCSVAFVLMVRLKLKQYITPISISAIILSSWRLIWVKSFVCFYWEERENRLLFYVFLTLLEVGVASFLFPAVEYQLLICNYQAYSMWSSLKWTKSLKFLVSKLYKANTTAWKALIIC